MIHGDTSKVFVELFIASGKVLMCAVPKRLGFLAGVLKVRRC